MGTEGPYPDGCPTAPQVLYLLGAMLLSMALQMDRHGLWNLLGPSLFALGIMAIAWVRRCPCPAIPPFPILAVLSTLPNRLALLSCQHVSSVAFFTFPHESLFWAPGSTVAQGLCPSLPRMPLPATHFPYCRQLAPSGGATATHRPGSAGLSTCAQEQ